MKPQVSSAETAARELWVRAAVLRRASAANETVTVFPHRTETLAADGLTWVLRVLTGPAPHPPTEPDPFLPPYDPHTYVADLGMDHVLLLNKYPVLAEHLLIVTRAALPQAAFPEPGDFSATAMLLLDGLAALAFYNGGPESGASQPHRHFQAVRLPLGPAPASIPTQDWIKRALAGADLPFPGAAAALDPDLWNSNAIGACLHETAAALLMRCGRNPAAPGSFNLLFTRDWMLAVPRSRRKFKGVSVNSLGYAGALIAKSDAALATLAEPGPLAILRAAAGADVG